MAHPDVGLHVVALVALAVDDDRDERARDDVVAALGERHARPLLPLSDRPPDVERAPRDADDLGAGIGVLDADAAADRRRSRPVLARDRFIDDNDLRGAEFFDVSRFPTATFKSKRVEPAASGAFKLVGDLTIRGTTKEVTLDAEAPAPVTKGMKGMVTGTSATTRSTCRTPTRRTG